MTLFALLREQEAQSEWSAVYMILIFAIVALLIIYLIKPMFRESQKIVTKTTKSVSG